MDARRTEGSPLQYIHAHSCIRPADHGHARGCARGGPRITTRVTNARADARADPARLVARPARRRGQRRHGAAAFALVPGLPRPRPAPDGDGRRCGRRRLALLVRTQQTPREGSLKSRVPQNRRRRRLRPTVRAPTGQPDRFVTQCLRIQEFGIGQWSSQQVLGKSLSQIAFSSAGAVPGRSQHSARRRD